MTTLRRLLTNVSCNVKEKDGPKDRQGAVKQDQMLRLPGPYIGETGRNRSTRLTAHKRATRNGDVNNHIAEHHLRGRNIKSAGTLRHVFRILQTTTDQRLTVESWYKRL